MELLNVDSTEQVRQKLLDCVKNWDMPVEDVSLEDCAGRILARRVYAGADVPGFRRSTVDGYAVMAKDTAAAGDRLPVFLSLAGEIEMGREADVVISSGMCAYVPTGGMLPEGANAVVMVEYSEAFGADGIALYTAVAPGENTVLPGEDVQAGRILLEQGIRLVPQSVGALAAAGITMVPVYKGLGITIISTGDELVTPSTEPKPGQVRDINTYALKALAEKNGFRVLDTLVVPDDEALLEKEIRSAMAQSDIVAVSGGSSQGNKDMTKAVIDRVSVPGVLTHGMAVKPGKPTILGFDEASGTILAGLPGHPVSAMMVFEILFCWLHRRLTGCPAPWPVPARLTGNIPASPGKTTLYPARLLPGKDGYLAEPVFGKSGLITTLTGADGWLEIEKDREGLQVGELVYLYLF